MKRERPLFFFTILFAALSLLSLTLAVPVVITFLETGLVPRFPTALLVTGIAILAVLSLMAGVVLDTVTHGRRENKRLHYLAHPAFEPSAAVKAVSSSLA